MNNFIIHCDFNFIYYFILTINIYQQRVLKLIRLVEKIISPGCNNTHGRYNLADIQTIYSTLDALTRYQPYLTLEAVVGPLGALYFLFKISSLFLFIAEC